MAVKDMNIKHNEDTKPVDNFNLDNILIELGSFGKYQLLLLLLLAFRDSFLGMCNYNFVLTTTDVPFRCIVPECDSNNSIDFNASWRKFALPNDTKSCRRKAINNVASESINHWLRLNSSCSPDSFSKDRTIRCDKVVYENYNSVVSEFDFGCEPWKRTLVGTVHNLGLVFSFILYGIISDRYGRKVIIVGTPLMVAIAGIIKSFAVNYWMLVVLEFLETSLGYGNASLVLSLETVSHKRRVVFSCILDSISSFGTAFIGLIAWKIPYWRYFLRAIYAPLLVAVFYIFLVDEGVRWLLAHDKKHEAVHVLNKVAKVNNVTLSSKAKEMLIKISEEKIKTDQKKKLTKADSSHLMTSLRSRTIVVRVALIAACFFCSMFVLTGAIINSANISGNKYLNITVIMLAHIPARVIVALTLTKYGRKGPIFVAYMLCGAFFVTSAFVIKNSWSTVSLYVGGMICSSFGVFSFHVVAMEIFPTTTRNSLLNISTTIGRLSSVLAPQSPLLDRYMSGLPSLLYGIVAVIAALLALLLPDSSRSDLPEDVTAAEKIDTVVNGDKIEKV